MDKLQTYEALLSRLAPEVDDDDKKAIREALSRVIIFISARCDVVDPVIATSDPILRYDVNPVGVW